MLAKLVLCAVLCLSFIQISLASEASEEVRNVFQTNAAAPRRTEMCNSYIANIKKGIRNLILLFFEGVGLPVVFGGIDVVCMVTTYEIKNCFANFIASLWHLARYLVKYTAVIVATIAFAVYGAAVHCFADYFVGYVNPLLLAQL